MGNVDLKTNSIHFQVQRSSEFTGTNATITFEMEKFNIGGAMDIATGVFTAPVGGIYHFAFSAMTIDYLQIILRVNDFENAAATSVSASTTNSSPFGLSVSLSSYLYLNGTDTVSVFIFGTGTLSKEIIENAPNTIFGGWLVEEV